MVVLGKRDTQANITKLERRDIAMKWSTPAFEDMRFGFEINLYINNR
ncbi:MAG: pyrroloquinoline quinone precursor peptide PqqA [Gammaproteobacteria bacterium]|nr:pyrroloquinoline quinone precursor peptide PqqA [Gammaproteobacteria bacterium]